MLKTLGKIDWKDIKVGEVFADEGCWQIWCKINKDNAMLIAIDYEPTTHMRVEGEVIMWEAMIDPLWFWGNDYSDNTYKLSKATQRLWKIE